MCFVKECCGIILYKKIEKKFMVPPSKKKSDLLCFSHLRWNFVYRWSLMLYGGTGKAFDDWSDFGSADWISSYGTGFRYLLARKFKLRVGIDVARGPEKWAYYIVFGSSWTK